MPLKILYVWMVLFLLGCSQAETKKNKAVDSIPSSHAGMTDFKTLDTVLPFSGVWVNEEYIKKLKKTGSPRESQDIGEACLTIPERTLQDFFMVYGFHEGGEAWVVVKKGLAYEIYDKEFKARVRSIEIISPDQIKIGDRYFSKLKHPDPQRDDMNILEELLFSGHYLLPDGKVAAFNVDGRVSGLDSFNYYNPMIDYTGEELTIDQVKLGSAKENMRPYGFRFTADSLIIYKTHCVEYDSTAKECGVVSVDEPVYNMLRKD